VHRQPLVCVLSSASNSLCVPDKGCGAVSISALLVFVVFTSTFPTLIGYSSSKLRDAGRGVGGGRVVIGLPKSTPISHFDCTSNK